MQCHRIDLFKYRGTRRYDVRKQYQMFNPSHATDIYFPPVQPYMPVNPWRPCVQSSCVAMCRYASYLWAMSCFVST